MRDKSVYYWSEVLPTLRKGQVEARPAALPFNMFPLLLPDQTNIECSWLSFTWDRDAVLRRRFATNGVPGVPDGGTTVMLLGAALGALGMARRFVRS